MTAHTTVRVNDDLAAGQAGITHRATDHEAPGWVHVWALDGNLLRGDPMLAGTAPPHEPRSGSEEWDGIGAVRVFSKAVDTYGWIPARVLIRAARPEAALRGALTRFAWILGTGFVAAVALAGLIGYALARHALAPMDRMAERASTITAESLAARLPVENPDDELGRLAAVFNGTFARLERSFGELRRFTADASHELRTPLASLRIVGEVGLREATNTEDHRKVIGSMLEEVDRLARLTDDLLALARAPHARLDVSPQDLAALAREVAQTLGVLAEEKNQTLLVEADASSRPRNVDGRLLRRALLNLVDNAVKFSPPGAEIRIRVTDRTIEVTDTGPGIAPEHRDKIFERLWRVDPARSRDAGGAGLGLALARAAVEAHGGSIELESEPNKGSTFRIVLPRNKGEDS